MKWLLIILMLPCVVLADIWPSWLSPMQGGYDRGNQVLSGAVERLTVVAGPTAWTNYATTNIWCDYFKQRTKCHAAKNILWASLPAGVEKWVFTNADFSPTNYVTITRTGLLARCGLPTNWWAVTPYFNLATETNGFRFWPLVLSNMVWMGYPVALDDVGATNQYWMEGLGDAVETSWEDAYNDAASKFVLVDDYSDEYDNLVLGVAAWVEAWVYQPDTNLVVYYGADIIRWFASVFWKARSYDVQVTNAASSDELWMRGTNEPVLGNTDLWDAFQDDVLPAWKKIGVSERAKGLAQGLPVDVGGTNAPEWDAIIAAITNETTSVGWENREAVYDSGDAWHVLHKFHFQWFP